MASRSLKSACLGQRLRASLRTQGNSSAELGCFVQHANEAAGGQAPCSLVLSTLQFTCSAMPWLTILCINILEAFILLLLHLKQPLPDCLSRTTPRIF